jgi:hypothetical protein
MVGDGRACSGGIWRWRLTLLSSSLADLGGETSLDGGDGATGAAGVASDEVESVLTLIELGVWGAAGLAGDVFDYDNELAEVKQRADED